MEKQKFKLSKKESLIFHYKNLEQLLEAIIINHEVYIKSVLNDINHSNFCEINPVLKISELIRKKWNLISLAESICRYIFSIYNQSPRVFQLVFNYGLKDSVAYKVLSVWFNRRSWVRELIFEGILLGLIDFAFGSDLLNKFISFRGNDKNRYVQI